jgi:hypothetical protein
MRPAPAFWATGSVDCSILPGAPHCGCDLAAAAVCASGGFVGPNAIARGVVAPNTTIWAKEGWTPNAASISAALRLRVASTVVLSNP